VASDREWLVASHWSLDTHHCSYECRRVASGERAALQFFALRAKAKKELGGGAGSLLVEPRHDFVMADCVGTPITYPLLAMRISNPFFAVRPRRKFEDGLLGTWQCTAFVVGRDRSSWR
jgi:hypothetical protein